MLGWIPNYHTVCPTELAPTFGFNNSTPRPGIITQFFFLEPCEHGHWFFTLKMAEIGRIEFFFSICNFFFRFSKNPVILSIPDAHFFKIYIFYS